VERAHLLVAALSQRRLPACWIAVAEVDPAARRADTVHAAATRQERTCAGRDGRFDVIHAWLARKPRPGPGGFEACEVEPMAMGFESAAASAAHAERSLRADLGCDLVVEPRDRGLRITGSRCSAPTGDQGWLDHHGASPLSRRSRSRWIRICSIGTSLPWSMPGHGLCFFAITHARRLSRLSGQNGQVRHWLGRER